ncbi:hypothetical protein ACOME3_009890 [Neoechinorhynchus agilis]
MYVYFHVMLLNLGSTIFRLQMYPIFDVCHYLLTIISVREEEHVDNPGSMVGTDQKARRHPFPRWITSVFACYAGSIVGNLLLGEPMLSDLRDNRKIGLITITWYLIFYSPFDLLYRLLKCRVTKISLYLFKEIQRVRKIHDAVMHASHLYPGAYILMILLGTIKGCGTYMILISSRLLFGTNGAQFIPTDFTHLSITSKASALTAILFTCQRESLIDVNKYLLTVGIVAFMYYIRILTVVFPNYEPFSILENLVTGCLFGGWWNAMERACRKVAMSSSSACKRDAGCADYKAVTELDKLKDGKKRD